MYKVERKYEVPEFYEFPENEYKMRIKTAQEAMEREGLDALLLTQKENIEYFTGYMTTHWDIPTGFSIGTAVIPKIGEPVLIVPSFLRYTAEKTSWIKDIRGLERAHTTPRKFPDVVLATIREKELGRGTIGIETGRDVTVQMPFVDFERIKSSLPLSKFLSGADVIWHVRNVKSSLEIEMIKKACEVTVKAFNQLFQRVKAGITEREICSIFNISVLEEGADVGFINPRAGPERYPMADTFAYDRKLQKGDMLIVDGGAAYHGYTCDICRVGFVGEPSTNHKFLYETCLKAQRAGLEILRPSIEAKKVFEACMSVIRAAEVKLPVLDLIGHGIGLSIHEPPTVCADNLEKLQKGMVLCIEPWIYDWDGLGVFAVEDLVLITDNGYELLTPLDKEELWTIEA